ncbi:hypothetical protein [Candidatus Pyrohabitans sp.]
MRLIRRGDGTLVADLQGLDGARLQIAVRDIVKKLPQGARAEIIMDDPDTHEPILMALRIWGCQLLYDTLEAGTFRIGVRR